MKRSKDCPACRLVADRSKCADCAGKGTIPLAPAVGSTVVIFDSAGTPQPLIVTRSERVRHGDQFGCHVEVMGWKIAVSRFWVKPGPEDLKWVDGLGWVAPVVSSQPVMAFVEKAIGPSDEPGCWNWPKEPS